MIIGPVVIEGKIHLIEPESGSTAVATYGFGPGKTPSPDKVREAIKQSTAAAPPGFRPMTEDEFFNKVVVKEATGTEGKFAVPADFRFAEDPAAN